MLQTAAQNATMDLITSVRDEPESPAADEEQISKNQVDLHLDREKIKQQCRALLETVRLTGSKRNFAEMSSQHSCSPANSTESLLLKKFQKPNSEQFINRESNIFSLFSSKSEENSPNNLNPKLQQLQGTAMAYSSDSSFDDGDEEEGDSGGDVDGIYECSDVDPDSQSESMECCEDPISVEENSITFPKFEIDQFIVESAVDQQRLSSESDDNDTQSSQTAAGILDACVSADERVLVLDLDNTLVHSFLGLFTGEGCESIEQDPSITLIATQEQDQRLMVKRRAYLEEFLKLAFENFQVVMYTLGSITYARAVHEIFKEKMPNIFSSHSFLRIIAQSATRSPGQQNIEKNISKYFSLSKFSHRLLVLDDNSQVYHNEWQRNIIFTKPFKFWHPDGLKATLADLALNNSDQDYFLFYAHNLLSELLVSDPLKDRITWAFSEQQMSILADEIIAIQDPENQAAIFMALKMGATLTDHERRSATQTIPTTTIYNTEEYISNESNDDSDGDENNETHFESRNGEVNRHTNSIDVVSEDWLKCCYVYSFKIPKQIWHQVKSLPNLETAMASLI